jgi:hypothetical protein
MVIILNQSPVMRLPAAVISAHTALLFEDYDEAAKFRIEKLYFTLLEEITKN